MMNKIAAFLDELEKISSFQPVGGYNRGRGQFSSVPHLSRIGERAGEVVGERRGRQRGSSTFGNDFLGGLFSRMGAKKGREVGSQRGSQIGGNYGRRIDRGIINPMRNFAEGTIGKKTTGDIERSVNFLARSKPAGQALDFIGKTIGSRIK